MTEHDYLWDQRGLADEFVVELERRLAPLDEAEDFAADLDLEALADASSSEATTGEDPGPNADNDAADDIDDAVDDAVDDDANDDAVILILHETRPAQAERHPDAESRARSWPWLAAAVAVLGLSVGVLVSEGETRRERARTAVEIGASEGSGRVVITADDQATHVRLRPAHADLSGCALELEGDASRSLELRIDAGVVEFIAPPTAEVSDPVRDCVEAAARALELDAPARFELELHGPETQL